jgi:DNA-binding NarL/FixJ family response regulator
MDKVPDDRADRVALIADDDEYFRMALSAIIRGPLGFGSVIETRSLDEAFDRLSSATRPVSLGLFDLRMPGVSSPANLAAVRECYPSIRVAVVSASHQKSDIIGALESGLHGYIPKSFDANDLVRALNIIVSGDIFVPALLADLPAIAPKGEELSSSSAVQHDRQGAAPMLVRRSALASDRSSPSSSRDTRTSRLRISSASARER